MGTSVQNTPETVPLENGGEGKWAKPYPLAPVSTHGRFLWGHKSPVLSGALYDLLGMRHVFFIFGTIFVALSFVTMFFVKHGDAKPEKQDALEALAGAED